MHSSRMSTGRSLTVCWSLLAGGGCLLGGGTGDVCSGGVCSEGVCLLLGGCLLWGVSAPRGGVCSGGGICSWRGVCSQGGVCSWGVCLLLGCVCCWGVSALGGCLLRGYTPACIEGETPPPVDRQPLVKILPWPNFVAAGKNKFNLHFVLLSEIKGKRNFLQSFDLGVPTGARF